MTVKWKKKEKLKPQVILEKMYAIRLGSSETGLSYNAFDYYEVMAVLLGILSFPPRCDGLDHESILSKAIKDLSAKGELHEQCVIEEINRIVNQQLATPEETFSILTSISLEVPAPIRSIVVEKTNIRILSKGYPKKYVSRTSFLDRINRKEKTPEKYAKVIVSVKDRSPRGAERKASNSLNLLRSAFCFNANTDLEIFGNDQWSPINKIRLGEVHTVHRNRGNVFEDMFWYEPNFKKTMPCKFQNPKTFTHNTKWVLSNIEELKYRKVMKESLIRFVRALDESNQNLAIIKLWSALEVLTIPSGSNYDLLTRRCAFLFSEYEYHHQVLEQIREYRNSNVHTGEENDQAKSYCFLLQKYYRELVHFHLRQPEKFKSLDEANGFLDLPTSKSKLLDKKQLIERAIVFRK